jgi:threonine dehydratase
MDAEGIGFRFEDVLAARRHVYRHVHRTPLLHYPGLSDLVGASIHVKHENHHAVGAFKVRGGVHLAAHLSERERAAGLYTASTGNHGQSIAFAGKVTGTKVRVAVPQGANAVKVAAMRRLGAEVIEHGADFDEAREWIQAEAACDNARFVGPTEAQLIPGVGTCALEIMEDLPEADVIVVPVGAGSGVSSACLVAKTVKPTIQVIAVQAEKAPAIYRSWREGRPVDAPMETAAEGLATRVAFENTLRVMRHPTLGIDDFLLVSDQAMVEAARLLITHAHTLAELAGAASLAAALSIRDRLKGKNVALVLSGGNISREQLSAIVGDGG